MIKHQNHKIKSIVKTIRTKISKFDKHYREGPSLYFYQRTIQIRNNYKSITSFVKSDYNIEMLYATLVSWDMNSRGAKMKYFDEFKENINSCATQLKQLDKINKNYKFDLNVLIPVLENIYHKLELMETKSKLVINSKLLHFLFPKMLMPMDRRNTLYYFYRNHNESINKYIEIIKFSLEIMNMSENLGIYSDKKWNPTVPKMIDNAIILLVGKSVR